MRTTDGRGLKTLAIIVVVLMIAGIFLFRGSRAIWDAAPKATLTPAPAQVGPKR